MFRQVEKNDTFPGLENRILNLWDKTSPFDQSLKQTDPSKSFVFYDGPPFATGLPHYGHLLAGTIKDIVPRYYSMKGFHVPRRFGWDCHGLPVESLIQNELELSGVSEINDFGVDKFNEACRSSVLKYTSEWEQTVKRMGRWVDFENDYKTMDSSFMESVWWVFSECWKKGLIYQGYRIQPYSPSLATPLSNFETNQGYKDRQDPSLTIKFKLADSDEELIVWTTTPWTLPSNMAVAVGPEIEYVLVESEGSKYWVADSRKEIYFGEEANVVDKKTGVQLAGRSYETLFSYMPTHKELYKIQLADFVSTENGTGAVHIAPSFGEDDFNLGKELGLPLFDPLDTEGKFTSIVPEWEGQGAKDADKSIISNLKAAGRVFKHETFVHSYPHCYRTGVPLLYRALKTWFLGLDVDITSAEGVTKTLKQWMIDSNQEITWVPSHIKDGRFGKWLDGARDWNISRNRFWGTPLPIWMSEDGDSICVGSIEQLQKLTGQKVDDLHSHFVDALEVKTSDGETFDPNGKVYKRTPEVFDCWFESGSMPYAQNHYPFNNKEYVEENFPADFIAEGLDQTRGWFYTLTVLSAALFQKPAFKNVVVNGIILAEDGQKMSKSLRNYPDPNILIEKTGADAIRLFMINSAAVKGEDLKFSETGVREIVKSVLLPLYNALSLYVTYANADSQKGQITWDPSQERVSSNELDRWIVALQQKLLGQIEEEMEGFRMYNVVPSILEFIENLTNWYIRRSRRRFWKNEDVDDKNDAYATLHTVLVGLSKALAPFLPFFAEEMYQILVAEIDSKAPNSVHLTEFPTPDQSKVDMDLVDKMDKVRSIVNMGRLLRAQNSLKNRQPLQSLTIVTRSESDKEAVKSMEELILEELNIRTLEFSEVEADLVSLSAKANFKTLGRRMGKNMKSVAGIIGGFDGEQITKLGNGESFETEFGELTSEDILIQREVKEGLVVEANEWFTVALDTVISESLQVEGMAREIVNRIQVKRKGDDLQVTDKIVVTFETSSEMVKKALEEYKGYISGETLCAELSVGENLTDAEDVEMNEEMASFTLVKS
jgi:isoleucyl-tRNA synthetase